MYYARHAPKAASTSDTGGCTSDTGGCTSDTGGCTSDTADANVNGGLQMQGGRAKLTAGRVADDRVAIGTRNMLFFADSETGSNYGSLTAAATVITAPLVLAFLIARRRFIEGITMTGIK